MSAPSSGSKVPKYDYYNPSTWLVQQHEEVPAEAGQEEAAEQEAQRVAAEAAKTNDAFARFAKNIAAADQLLESPPASPSPSSSSPSRPKPEQQLSPAPSAATPPKKGLPYRVGGMKIFADEHVSSDSDSDSDFEDGNESGQWAAERGFPGMASPPRPQRMRRAKGEKQAGQGRPSELEQRKRMLAQRAKQDQAKCVPGLRFSACVRVLKHAPPPPLLEY